MSQSVEVHKSKKNKYHANFTMSQKANTSASELQTAGRSEKTSILRGQLTVKL